MLPSCAAESGRVGALAAGVGSGTRLARGFAAGVEGWSGLGVWYAPRTGLSSSSSESESNRMLRRLLSRCRVLLDEAAADVAGVFCAAALLTAAAGLRARDCRMRSRRNLSLSESESESATKRRRAPVLGRFAGRAEAAEGVAGRFAGDAADDTGASDGPRVAGFRSRGDAARRVWGVGDAARTTGVGLGARTTGVGLGARTGLERGPGASSPPPACKVPFVGCTDGTPLPPRASSFCWHVSRIRVAFFSCSMHARRVRSSGRKAPAGRDQRG